MSTTSRLFSAALSVALALSICPAIPLGVAAYAAEGGTAAAAGSQNFSAEQDASTPCMPSEEEIASYKADGTYDDRLAFQQSLGNEDVDAGLIESAKARESSSASGATAYSQTVPTNWESGMGSVGTAHVLALHVTFPDEDFAPAAQFRPGDTAEALQNLIGPITAGVSCDVAGYTPNDDAYPYESLDEYYNRSSYGKLRIDGATFEYKALHPASYYGAGLETLYVEALEQLDGRIDYSRFDGNADGKIDAIYVHFACENPQWGTAWWSNEETCLSEAAATVRDGVRLWNAVSLHNASNTIDGSRTIIHETGHVLGLPDLYSYRDQSSTNAGLRSFDMMNANCGDHNGFSKWLLGWVDADDIIRIVANENGVKVKDGAADVVSYAPESSVEATLSTFAGSSCGGIVVLSNSEELLGASGMFSSFYLVQYDDYEGNQLLSAQTIAGEIKLPAGFRVFRIQANLLPSGVDFAHTNTYGTVYNQLIELVDPDDGVEHEDHDGFLVARGASEYGCSYHQGDSITPKTFPSTNFFESLNLGFTGLSIEFASETPASASAYAKGTLRASYSPEFKPTLTDFSIKRTSDEPLFNIDSIALEASCEVKFNPAGGPGGPAGSPRSQGAYPYINVDGAYINASAAISGKKIDVKFSDSATTFSGAKDVNLVFPAGTFLIGYDAAGEAVLSPEVTIPLSMATLADIDFEGAYEGTDKDNNARIISNVFATEDGTRHFLQVANGMLRLCTIDTNDPTRVSIKDLKFLEAGMHDNMQISVVGTIGQGAFAMIYPPEGIAEGSCMWFDAQTGAVTNEGAVTTPTRAALISCGNAILTSEYAPQSSGLIVTLYEPLDDGSFEKTCAFADAAMLMNVEATSPAFADQAALVTMDYAATATATLRVVDAQALVDAVSSKGYASVGELIDAGCPDISGDLQSESTLELQDTTTVVDIALTETGYCTLSKTFKDDASAQTSLALFDSSGNRITTGQVPTYDTPAAQDIHIGPGGAIAVEHADGAQLTQNQTHRVIFYDNALNRRSDLLAYSYTGGTWLADGRWITVGWKIEEASHGAGSPLPEEGSTPPYQGVFVNYTITSVLDAPNGGSGEGEGGATGEGTENSGSQTPPGAAGQHDASSVIPATGDATPAAALMLAFLAACALAALLKARRREA